MQSTAAAPPFVVARNDAGDVVEAFSTERLPYEPRGWLLDLRAELRAALKQLSAHDGALLSGVYASHIEEFCDVENVLIYNVGASNFAGSAVTGIRLERGYFCPSPPIELSDEARHHSCYSVAPVAQGFACWERGATLAEWSGVPIAPLSETSKPAEIWHAMRTAAVQLAGARVNPAAPYGLELEVGVPGQARPKPAKIVKPLVDGVIAGLHSHDGSALADVSGRLAAQLPGNGADDIAELLVDSGAAPLGERRLVWPRAASVQWNPADDFCLALELRVVASDRLELAGKLVEIGERRPSG